MRASGRARWHSPAPWRPLPACAVRTRRCITLTLAVFLLRRLLSSSAKRARPKPQTSFAMQPSSAAHLTLGAYLGSASHRSHAHSACHAGSREASEQRPKTRRPGAVRPAPPGDNPESPSVRTFLAASLRRARPPRACGHYIRTWSSHRPSRGGRQPRKCIRGPLGPCVAPVYPARHASGRKSRWVLASSTDALQVRQPCSA